jgi:hypothetical protein
MRTLPGRSACTRRTELVVSLGAVVLALAGLSVPVALLAWRVAGVQLGAWSIGAGAEPSRFALESQVQGLERRLRRLEQLHSDGENRPR